VGTLLLFSNDHVRVWELRLAPGERAPFHRHATPYIWTCVDSGIGRQRSRDGTVRLRRYAVGETEYAKHSSNHDKVHDQENAGETILRFVTVELLNGRFPTS
jgi:anti-sigma factor ChrR (cupin superfamily)